MKVQVRQGDTLWYYSYLFMVPLELIIKSNPALSPTQLSISQEIKIPGFQLKSYLVKRGDTLSKLAASRNLPFDALLLLNPNLNPNELSIGETIHFPNRITSPVVAGKEAYTFETLLKDINHLKKAYPFISIRTVGKSVLGKPIHEIRIGSGEKKIHLNASFHANEWITSSVLMKVVNKYLLAVTNGESIRGIAPLPLFLQTDISIVPMVNPDGVNLVLEGPPPKHRVQLLEMNKGSSDFSGWKANLNGVDLNNQFPANWEIEKGRKEPKAPASRDYPGVAPLTEPEAIVMSEIAKTNQYDRVVAFHTQGEEFYWGYQGMEPHESKEIAAEFTRVSGYQAVQYIDSHAGYKDWFIQEFRKTGFTIELGKGVNPLPLSQFDHIYEEALGIFLASLYM